MSNEIATKRNSGRLIITGASGFLGRNLIAMATDEGWTVDALSRRPIDFRHSGVSHHTWSLGEDIPTPLLRDCIQHGGADAIIHLAHDWKQDGKSLTENLNLTGARILCNSHNRGIARRFILASSQASRPNQPAGYGQVKYEIEAMISEADSIAARIGLVWGGNWGGPTGKMLRIIRLLPLVPVVTGNVPIYPVHIEDVCKNLLTLVSADWPPGKAAIIAPSTSITLREFLQSLARHVAGRRHPLVLPLPRWLFALVALLPGLDANLKQRLQGLLHIASFYTEDALYVDQSTLRAFPSK